MIATARNRNPTVFLKAIKRLWRLGTCDHRGARMWPLLFSGENGPIEMLFCRSCGRLLMACRTDDQPQHNQHWLKVDQLDDERYIMWPQDQELRALAMRDYGAR